MKRLGSSFLGCVAAVAFWTSPTGAQTPTTMPSAIDQATIDAAMEKLRAKQAVGEAAADKISRLEAENRQLRQKLAQQDAALASAAEGMLKLSGLLVGDVPLEPVPDSAGSSRDAWRTLMSIAVAARLQCTIQDLKNDAGQNNEQQMLASISEFRKLRQLVRAPATSDGRKVAACLAASLDQAETAIAGMRAAVYDSAATLDVNRNKSIEGADWEVVLTAVRGTRSAMVNRSRYEAANHTIKVLLLKLCADQGTTVEAQLNLAAERIRRGERIP